MGAPLNWLNRVHKRINGYSGSWEATVPDHARPRFRNMRGLIPGHVRPAPAAQFRIMGGQSGFIAEASC
jgi:hypothetical protein